MSHSKSVGSQNTQPGALPSLSGSGRDRQRAGGHGGSHGGNYGGNYEGSHDAGPRGKAGSGEGAGGAAPAARR